MANFSDVEKYVPGAPAMAVLSVGAAWCEPHGEPVLLDHPETSRYLQRNGPVILCHGPVVASRLGLEPFRSFDVLELFAFVRPAQFCVPTIRGVSSAMGLPLPNDVSAQAQALFDIAGALLAELDESDYPEASFAASVASRMESDGWLWGNSVVAVLGDRTPSGNYNVWNRLAEWVDRTPSQSADLASVTASETRSQLADLLGTESEARPEQADYASAASMAFVPRKESDPTRVVIAEAGTGVGKTLGYIAPASLWARKNGGTVWLSTYTKNLQGQIDRELDRLYPDRETKHQRVVIRKGRENYLCLLNYEEAVNSRIFSSDAESGALGLLARWIAATRDGDMIGGDFPAWLGGLLRQSHITGLADHRGECIYSACSHYRKCFVESAVRRARHAELVISNHSLVMVLGARNEDIGLLPSHYVFDEGHHLFDAADSTFTSRLSGRDTFELRRWLLGIEVGSVGRTRGLKGRIGDLVAEDSAAMVAMKAILESALMLPATGWQQRVADRSPRGEVEIFLCCVHQQVITQARPNDGYDLETRPHPCVEGLLPVAMELERALSRLGVAMSAFELTIDRILHDSGSDMESGKRFRLEAVSQSLCRRRLELVTSWQTMLVSLACEVPKSLIDRFAIERSNGRELDVGMYRNWVDPMVPFTESVVRRADGVLITSATLRDGTGDLEKDWVVAEKRVGAHNLLDQPIRAAVASPFDYDVATRVIVVNDVDRNNADEVARAMLELFVAAGGGALGLFTAIWRLRRAEKILTPALDKVGLNLLAQHVDHLDAGTLVEIFRSERDSCLLGTDALRDGIDVPGASLRMVVFDRVPWPRSDILHQVRRGHFGGSAYDDMMARMKLKQAYGRLVRRENDFGVFVILDPATPTRLLGAFPDGVQVTRVGRKEAVAEAGGFIRSKMSQ